jgi:hypothetical protein
VQRLRGGDLPARCLSLLARQSGGRERGARWCWAWLGGFARKKTEHAADGSGGGDAVSGVENGRCRRGSGGLVSGGSGDCAGRR